MLCLRNIERGQRHQSGLENIDEVVVIVHVDVASAAAVTIGPRVTATVIVLDVLRYMHSLGSPRIMWTGSGS